MIHRSAVITAAVLAQLLGTNGECPDPVAAVLATLKCIEHSDAACATAGYDSANFAKLHNGVDTNTVISDDGAFWQGAFALTSFDFGVDHQINVGTNKASVRYVERVALTSGESMGLPPSNEYPFGQEFVQHEHALVTVDDDCRIVLWDQYGDNKEQKDVDSAVNAILCTIGFLPAEICSSTPEAAADEPITTPEATAAPAKADPEPTTTSSSTAPAFAADSDATQGPPALSSISFEEEPSTSNCRIVCSAVIESADKKKTKSIRVEDPTVADPEDNSVGALTGSGPTMLLAGASFVAGFVIL